MARWHGRLLIGLVICGFAGGCAVPARQAEVLEAGRMPTVAAPRVAEISPAASVATITVSTSVASTQTQMSSSTPSLSRTPTTSRAPTMSRTPTASRTLTASRTATQTASATPSRTPTAAPSPTSTPGPTPDGVVRTLTVPILMYHYASQPPPDADVYRRDLSVSPVQFESHLKYLADNGYRTITLDDLLYALAHGRELPARPVILTFDDGYADNYTNAFPLLEKYDMMAHFFVISDFVNQERPGYMTWPQIEEMAAAGQRFGSHSRDHPSLAGQERRLPGVAGVGRQRSACRAPGRAAALDQLPGRPSTMRRPSSFTSRPDIGVG